MKKTSLALIALTPSTILKFNSKNGGVLREFDKLDNLFNSTAKETVSKLIDSGNNWWDVKVTFDWKKKDQAQKKVGDLEVIVRWERKNNRTYYSILTIRTSTSPD